MSHSPTPQSPVFRNVTDIPFVRYGAVQGGMSFDMEPTRADIQAAIDSEQLEARGFQADLTGLETEWNERCNGNLGEFFRLQKQYHVRRVAYFVVNGWKEPIELTAEGKMRDGLHRFKAAVFRGMDRVEVTIDSPN